MLLILILSQSYITYSSWITNVCNIKVSVAEATIATQPFYLIPIRMFFLPCMVNILRHLAELMNIWDKVFKNETSKICGREPLKKNRRADHIIANFLKDVFHKFYFVISWILYPILFYTQSSTGVIGWEDMNPYSFFW